MSYVNHRGNIYGYFGGLSSDKSIAASPKHPEKILKKAKANPASALDAFLSPIRTIAKTAVEKASDMPTQDEILRAHIERVLLQHNLIAPNPNWESSAS